MKKFWLYFLFISLVLIVLMYLLDYVYTKTYNLGIPRNKVSYVLSIGNKKIDYIFLGSSRVENTIDISIIEAITKKKAINLGLQGAKLDDIYLMLQLLVKQKVKAEYIFIQVDYIYNHNDNSEILKSSLMPFISDPLIANFIKERDARYYAFKYIPFYRYLVFDYKLGFREFISTLLNKKSRINFENGFDGKKGMLFNNMVASLPNDIKFSNRSIDSINYIAKKNNLNIIYFISPYCNNTKNKDFTKKLKSKFDNFIDYSEIIKEDKYFYNCTHLNAEGAKIFSKVIAEDIKNNF